MLLNKHFEILKHFIGDFKVERYGRELAKRTSLSQKAVALSLKELEEKGILKSKTKGNIKNYSLNLKNRNLKDIIIQIEIFKKLEFLKKYRFLKEIFNGDNRVVGIFGSYAKGTETKDSDIDLFIIGEELKQDYDKKGELFDLEISIKYFRKKEFKKLLREKNNLVKEIVKNHVLISGFESFVYFVWRDFHGFD
jgi:predicted nucleotidyltransferase